MKRRALLLAALLSAGGGPLQAQVGPTTEQAARYTGLHAAAHRGDLPALDRLLAARPAAALLNARDAHGRTAAARGHLCAPAPKPSAALAQRGRRPACCWKNDRYDAVTIAAVADDEATLRVLLELGASAQARDQPLRRHGADRRGAPGARRRGAPADRRPARRWTT
jgi:hypothetical protein